MTTISKKTKTAYWIFTGLFAAFMLMSAIPDITVMELAVNGFREIGLGKPMVPFLGIAKLLGIIAILVPGFPKIKEWAYAGLMFDLIGAVYLIICAGKPVGDWLPVAIPIIIGIFSYRYYHKKLSQA